MATRSRFYFLNLDIKLAVLVEQFKVPVLVARQRDDPSTTDGWIVETTAGNDRAE